MDEEKKEQKKVEVEVSEDPGLIELLEAGQPPPAARLDPAVGDYLDSGGVKGSAIEAAIGERAKGVSSATGESATDWWQALKAWWNQEEHRVIATEELPVELAAYWLTLPAVDGASVTVVSTRSSSKESSAALSIAGVGGGPSFELTVTDEISFEGTASERAFLTTNATFEKVEVERAGKVVGTYARLKSLERGNFTWTRRAEQPPDPSTLGPPVESFPFDFTGASGPTTEKSEIAKGTTWELGADLKLWGVGVKLGGELTYKQEVSYANKLPGGHAYRARRFERFPARLWEVTH
jgi:hypothetical protein